MTDCRRYRHLQVQSEKFLLTIGGLSVDGFRSDRNETGELVQKRDACISDAYVATALTSTLRMQRVMVCLLYNSNYE